MKTNLYLFLKECAFEKKTIKSACEEKGVNPISVRRFLYKARKKPYMRHRVVKEGKYVGFKYDGVIVFWDRVKEVGREGKPETREGSEQWRE